DSYELCERRFTAGRRGARLCGQHTLVIARHHLDEFRHHLVPVAQHARTETAAGVIDVLTDERQHRLDIVSIVEWFEIDHLVSAQPLESPGGVEDVRDAAAHAGGEVPPGRAEDDDAPARHVLATVIADAFDDGKGAAVPDGKAFAGQAAEVRLAAR